MADGLHWSRARALYNTSKARGASSWVALRYARRYTMLRRICARVHRPLRGEIGTALLVLGNSRRQSPPARDSSLRQLQALIPHAQWQARAGTTARARCRLILRRDATRDLQAHACWVRLLASFRRDEGRWRARVRFVEYL